MYRHEYITRRESSFNAIRPTSPESDVEHATCYNGCIVRQAPCTVHSWCRQELGYPAAMSFAISAAFLTFCLASTYTLGINGLLLFCCAVYCRCFETTLLQAAHRGPTTAARVWITFWSRWFNGDHKTSPTWLTSCERSSTLSTLTLIAR